VVETIFDEIKRALQQGDAVILRALGHCTYGTNRLASGAIPKPAKRRWSHPGGWFGSNQGISLKLRSTPLRPPIINPSEAALTLTAPSPLPNSWYASCRVKCRRQCSRPWLPLCAVLSSTVAWLFLVLLKRWDLPVPSWVMVKYSGFRC